MWAFSLKQRPPAQDYVRAPAHITRPSRDTFVLTVPPAADGADSVDGADGAARASSAQPDGSSPPSSSLAADLSAMVAAGPAELLAALQRRAAQLSGRPGGAGKPGTGKPEEPPAVEVLPPADGAGDAAPRAEAEPAKAEDRRAGEPRGKSAWVKVAGEVGPTLNLQPWLCPRALPAAAAEARAGAGRL